MKDRILGILLTSSLLAALAGCRHCPCCSCPPSDSLQPKLAVQSVEVSDSGEPPIVRLAEPPRSILVR